MSPLKNISNLKIIISGGGTGGHIFPAIAIADAIKKERSDAEFLFIGAKGKIEMEKVPAAGYKIEGLNVAGFHRRKLLKNWAFPFKLMSALWKAFWLIRKFKPNAVIGVGGYASGPTLFMASVAGVPVFIQEQNSFPGVTNKLLARRAKRIYTAYEEAEAYFKGASVKKFGNPIRSVFSKIKNAEEARKSFGFEGKAPIIFITGGSQGAMSINRAVEKNLNLLKERGFNLLWQCGKPYLKEALKYSSKNVVPLAFIEDMNAAYAACDVIIARSGAGTVAELAMVQKPVIFIPLASAAGDHQTKNAQALVDKEAAILLLDKDCSNDLVSCIEELMNNEELKKKLTKNIAAFALPSAAENIAKDILKELE